MKRPENGGAAVGPAAQEPQGGGMRCQEFRAGAPGRAVAGGCEVREGGGKK